MLDTLRDTRRNADKLRHRILNHIFSRPAVFKDLSTCPAYWNLWSFTWDGKPVRIFLQRWCKGRRKGQTNYIKVTVDGRQLLVKDLRTLADWLTDGLAADRDCRNKGQK